MSKDTPRKSVANIFSFCVTGLDFPTLADMVCLMSDYFFTQNNFRHLSKQKDSLNFHQ